MLETLGRSPEPIAGMRFPAKKANKGQQATYISMHIKPFINLFEYGLIGGINLKIILYFIINITLSISFSL